MGGSNPITSVAESAAAWARWIETIDDADRSEIVDLLSQYDTSTFEGMSLFLQQMIIRTFSGKISPVVIEAALPLIKELQSALFMVHKYSNSGPEVLGVAMRKTTQELFAQVSPVQARYITDRPSIPESADLVEGVEPELIPMRNEDEP